MNFVGKPFQSVFSIFYSLPLKHFFCLILNLAFSAKAIDLFSYHAGKNVFPYLFCWYLWLEWKRPLWSENCVCRPVAYSNFVISVLMQFLRNQTVWNCTMVNVEAPLRVCVYQNSHARCTGLEPQTGISLLFFLLCMTWKKNDDTRPNMNFTWGVLTLFFHYMLFTL